MYEFSEAIKGFSDIPISVIALVLGLFARKRETTKGFSLLFILVSFAAFVGALVHIFKVPHIVKTAVWVFLYFVLYECVKRFTFLFVKYIKKGENTPKFISFAEYPFYLLSVIFLIFVKDYDMLFFVFFSAVCIITITYILIKEKRITRNVLIFILIIPVVVLFQAFSRFIPYAVLFEHIVIAALLFLVYLMAIEKN